MDDQIDKISILDVNLLDRMLMSEHTKELLNYLYVAFEEIEKKQLIALDIQTLFT